MAPFQRPEPSPAYKIRDTFLWNLHEALCTPDDFAQTLVRELDLPNSVALAMSISQQIRTQLEEYAGIAMHPLFHTQSKTGKPVGGNVISNEHHAEQSSIAHRAKTSIPTTPSQLPPLTTAANTPSQDPTTPLSQPPAQIIAQASPVPGQSDPTPALHDGAIGNSHNLDPFLNPDDTYRCIVNLSIVLASRLYTDKFEWSLLHPPGFAEAFARQTSADLGLTGEWVLAITHAIYEAVLKLKKDVCEGGGMLGTGELDNQAFRAEEGAGWRYDGEGFGAAWAPSVESLSKDEIEKREGDRERQLRRVRRETAKFSSTSGMFPSVREQEAQSRAGYFDFTGGYGGIHGAVNGGGAGDTDSPNMGRGERTKRRRRFRSLSPVSKAAGASPAETSNGAGSGWGGADNKLQEYERQNWRCAWCLVWGTGVWAVRDGPTGSRVRQFAPMLKMGPEYLLTALLL